jgi:uncharacterized membrane protein YphA (DoxX/SURF4 family)
MIDWKTKLTSRKLWVAVTEFVSMLMVAFGYAEDTVTQVAALIMAGAGLVAYIVAEGLVDAKAAGSPYPLPEVEKAQSAYEEQKKTGFSEGTE